MDGQIDRQADKDRQKLVGTQVDRQRYSTTTKMQLASIEVKRANETQSETTWDQRRVSEGQR